MYDNLTGQYAFTCPARGRAKVRLSAFRTIQRLPGAGHPAVYRVRFSCGCGGEHDGLVAHDELDWAPLGLGAGSFLNFMTARIEPVSLELADLAARNIGAGRWPWSFFCYPEERPRPIFPSAFKVLAPGTAQGSVGVAVRCPVCSSVSVNLVSHEHVDLPFHNDRTIGIVQHVFRDDADRTLEEFRAELHSAAFDTRRLTLE